MNQERLLQVILSPHVSEKSTVINEAQNVYVFRVCSTATKPEVKDAIESLFNTKVASVNIVNMRAKRKIFKGREGQRKAWKKAYVKLQANQKIDLIEAK